MKKIFLILLCLCLFSCKKKTEEDYRPEFIGYWYCPPPYSDAFSFSITIDNNSFAVYRGYENGQEGSSIHGIARANDKHFKIGRIYSFKIIEYPHKIDTASSNVYAPIGPPPWLTSKKANWKMTLKGPILHAGDGSYYKADY